MKKRDIVETEVNNAHGRMLLLSFVTPGTDRIKTRRDVAFDGETTMLARTGMYYIPVEHGKRAKRGEKP